MRPVNPVGSGGDATSAIARPGSDAAAGGLASSGPAHPRRHQPPSDDPARHRIFEIRATYDAETGAWSARVGEQNLNEQRGDWEPELVDANGAPRFPTAAACLGDAVARLMTIVDQDAQDAP